MPVPSPKPVYNLYVDDACTFVSGDLVMHSYVILPNLRTSKVFFGRSNYAKTKCD
jgi:hypothetical protein